MESEIKMTYLPEWKNRVKLVGGRPLTIDGEVWGVVSPISVPGFRTPKGMQTNCRWKWEKPHGYSYSYDTLTLAISAALWHFDNAHGISNQTA